MNLKCLICSDLFLPHSEIYVTTCGHLFHHNCLLQWIERSRTCPQCRCKSTEKTIHRIYLSVEENPETTDASLLQHKLDNMQFQLKLKDMDIKNYTEKYETARAQNLGLREEIKDQENKTRVLESAMHALKEQTSYFKEKAKATDKLQTELVKLREKIKDMENVQLVLNGSREQVNDMLRHNRDPQSLTVLVSTLKKELIDSDRRRKQTQANLRNIQSDAHNYKKEVSLLTKENLKLQHDIEAHKSCETERQYLKKKIYELKEAQSRSSLSIVDTSTRRIVDESPAPLVKQLNKLKDETTTSTSPSVSDTVQAIKDSESPHLRIQSSTVGLSGLMHYNDNKYLSTSTSSKPAKFSIFKQQSVKETLKRPASQSSYNGLGGHSKDDEYPSPSWQPLGKRPKSSVTSAKFKKLAPGSQKKLNDFFTDSDCN